MLLGFLAVHRQVPRKPRLACHRLKAKLKLTSAVRGKHSLPLTSLP